MPKKISVPMVRLTISCPVDVIAAAKKLGLNVSASAVEGVKAAIERRLNVNESRRQRFESAKAGLDKTLGRGRQTAR